MRQCRHLIDPDTRAEDDVLLKLGQLLICIQDVPDLSRLNFDGKNTWEKFVETKLKSAGGPTGAAGARRQQPAKQKAQPMPNVKQPAARQQQPSWQAWPTSNGKQPSAPPSGYVPIVEDLDDDDDD